MEYGEEQRDLRERESEDRDRDSEWGEREGEIGPYNAMGPNAGFMPI